MPTYIYRCWDCEVEEEHILTFAEMDEFVCKCPKCEKEMVRRITGGLGTIFKGDGWVDKELRRNKEDDKIKIARRKAMRLKNSGAVPWTEQIKKDQAEGLSERMDSDVRKREVKKAEQAAKEMEGNITEE